MISAGEQQAVDLLIIGSSTRAAAFSAIRAGFSPLCLDQFADVDLRQHAPVRRVGDYPVGLLHHLPSLPKLPLIYVGGLENRTDILNSAAKHQILWGNDAAAVARVRDPHQLQDAARLARVSVPEVCFESDPPSQDGSWLLRPRLGSGGRGIRVWTREHSKDQVLTEPHYYQRRIEGESYSAVFIASGEPGDVRFVGVTRQLIGQSECHASDFQWCGNVGPVALNVNVENLIRRLGNVLKWKVGLLGLFGVDFIVGQDNVPWITEVNPRYPASLELLEHATGFPLLFDHAKCFAEGELEPSRWRQAHPGEFLGKAILYSPTNFTLRDELTDPSRISSDAFPTIADVPQPGERIREGEPVCTVFAESPSAEGVWVLLQQQLQELTSKIFQQSSE